MRSPGIATGGGPDYCSLARAGIDAALSLLLQHQGKKSIATKRFEAALDEQVLQEIIQDAILGEL